MLDYKSVLTHLYHRLKKHLFTLSFCWFYSSVYLYLLLSKQHGSLVTLLFSVAVSPPSHPERFPPPCPPYFPLCFCHSTHTPTTYSFYSLQNAHHRLPSPLRLFHLFSLSFTSPFSAHSTLRFIIHLNHFFSTTSSSLALNSINATHPFNLSR